MNRTRDDAVEPTRVAARFASAAALMLGLPLAGAVLAGTVPDDLLAFPPRPRPTVQSEFSWAAFAGLSVVVAAALGTLAAAVAHARPHARASRLHRFPAWGYWALIATLGFWLLAWTRIAWFAPLQHHTFTPLWIAFIVLLNALCVRRSGACPMIGHPRVFAASAALSAAFWWFFEYLNRFVGNWHYVGVDGFGALEYAVFATLAFSTVLPAVLSMTAWLSTFDAIDRAFEHGPRVRVRHPRGTAIAVLGLGVVSLVGVGAVPQSFFPAVWVSPLLVVGSLAALRRRVTGFESLADGDWRPIAVPALAALACGLAWETWNVGSLAHWEYAIPYVDRFHLFEMPLLGYAGYLPFGAVCIAVSQMLVNTPMMELVRSPGSREASTGCARIDP